MLFGLLPLLPLVVLGGLIYLIVRSLRSRRAGGTSGDAGSARRFFVYLALFLSFIVSAIGLSGLLGQVLATADVRADNDVAATLALVIVGVPVFVALARWAWRRLEADPLDRRSTGWSLYLNAALITSLVMSASTLSTLLVRLIDGTGYDGRILGMVVVWSAAWLLHWHAWRVVPPERAAALHLLAGSAIGLGMLAVGTAVALAQSAEAGFDRVGEVAIAGTRSDEIGSALVVAVVGLAVWAWHWLLNGVRGERTTPWLVYVLLYGVLGGLAATVIGAGRGLFLVLEWIAGDPEATTAVDQFRQLAPAIAPAIVGAAVWQYHRALVGPRAERARTDVDRTYDAIVAGAALATVAAAAVILVLSLFELAEPEDVSFGESSNDVLLAAITFFIVGGPLWWRNWRRMQTCAAEDQAEVTSAPRRIYLSSVIGVGALVAFGSLISLLVIVFETWLGERSGSLAEPLSWPVALLLTAGSIAAYHLVVMRGERHLYESEPTRDVLLVWAGDGEVERLAAATHCDIRVLHRSDVDGHPDVEKITDAIEHTAGAHLLVVAGQDDLIVVPYN
jgi:hypothetical protein